jgi:soluble lytic murein transglycosylase-like protein
MLTDVLTEIRTIERRILAFGDAPPVPRAPATARFKTFVERAAQGARVDPALVRAVIANESGFDPRATSSAGAQGLMQLMPATAAAYGVANPFDPAQNVAGGTSYLRDLLARFGGDLRLAVAAYNAGPRAVERYGGIPPFPETRAYVERVMAAYRSYGRD